MSKIYQKRLDESLAELEAIYFADSRPWVVPFSTGKDSTTVLQLISLMYIKLHKQGRANKPIHVVTSDTTVEMPVYANYLERRISTINDYMQDNGYDITAHVLKPKVEETFWSLLLGKGYPSPTKTFRWCTERLKINPAEEFLKELIGRHDSAILFLGVRRDESIARQHSIDSRVANHRGLNPHATIANAYTNSPIKDWTTSEVWSYLVDNPAPWGDHKDMMTLYDKGSGEADCNVALNPENSECGKTRFGCWTCTVVQKDSSMIGMIESGAKWMQPLVDYRDMLAEWREPESGKRAMRRRNGELSPGPFTIEARKELFVELIRIQEQMKRESDEATDLISKDEIMLIQELWNNDGDIENFAINSAISFGIDLPVPETNSILESIPAGINKDLLLRIYEIESYRKGIGKRHGIVNEIIKRTEDFHAGNYETESLKELQEASDEIQ